MPRRTFVPHTQIIDTPFGAYEQHMLRGYALSAFLPEKGKQSKPVVDTLVEWYKENRKMLGFSVSPLDKLLHRSSPSRRSFEPQVLRYTSRTRPSYRSAAPSVSSLQKRLDWVADTLRLTQAEAAFLGAVVRMTCVPAFRSLYEAVVEDRYNEDEVKIVTAAHMAGLSPRDSWRLADNRGSLLQLGLLEDRNGGDVAASATLIDLLATRSTNPRVLRSALLGPTSKTDLGFNDFSHLGTVRNHVKSILRGALARREKGVNLFMFGAPGTGKTEFAKVIAAELDADAVFIGEKNWNGDQNHARSEPSRADRLSHLAFASALAERTGRVILIVDEADDIFLGVDDEEYSNRSGSKVFMNRVIENCSVPVIWISNHPEMLGEAILRRMLCAVEFRTGDRSTRKRIIQRYAAGHGIDLTPDAVSKLSSIPATPALLETGIRAASLASAQGDTASEIAIDVTRSLLKVSGRDAPGRPIAESIAFDTALCNADIDLVNLERQVLSAGPTALSFLFSGLPGTGKSAFARHLSERLELEIMEKRGSDLLGMFVGETEKRIADAFCEAAEMKRFLIFDEADSLLADRSGAHRTWEVSQVNEMLTWMERHPTPFAATTNLSTRLDPATQRRFLFKVVFGEMTPEQAIRAFHHTFGVTAPAVVGTLPQLTPGDFSVVSRKARVLQITNAFDLAKLLESEVMSKPINTRRIGF